MSTPVINLTLFAPNFRQALLFAMIEGLIKGNEFSFIDDRDPLEIEKELEAAGLSSYTWSKCVTEKKSDSRYIIKRVRL